jgi:hypothetical protein
LEKRLFPPYAGSVIRTQLPEETDVCRHPSPPTPSRPSPNPHPPRCPAQALRPDQRQHLAVQALAKTCPLTDLADEAQVSRKFVYQQAAKARQALQDAFAINRPAAAEAVLFYLPVTKSWLRQLVLSLVLTCHSSLRGVTTLLDDVFDCPLAVGTVQQVVAAAVPAAQTQNADQDLGGVRLGAHDEIYQAGRPVLVGVDADSTYCYLLSAEDHCDADTWGVRLLELADRGLAPQATVADAALGQRAGQALALPGVPCRGDHFHLVQYFAPVQRTLEDRAYLAWATIEHLQRQQARGERRRGRKSLTLSRRLRHAQQVAARAVAVADDVTVLLRWLREDILAVAGPDAATRRELYDFVVAELQAREAQGPERLKGLRQRLTHQRDGVLAFAQALDEQLQALARGWAVSAAVPRELLLLQALPPGDARRWRREAALRRQLGARYYGLAETVAVVARQVVRASSVVENLNSRLRDYFFLRRQVGPSYLSLLQFYLNHRRFLRSERPERVGHSPRELLTGQAHPHWLELLGYTRFRRT